MIFGIPVIASDLEPNREDIKTNKNGLLYKNRDKFYLTKNVNCLLQDEELMLRISGNAKETAKSMYSWDKIAEKYLDL